MSALRFRDVVAWDALVAPGVIVQKDGSLLCAWHLRGIDTGHLALAETQALRVELARGLSTLQHHETLWLMFQRRPWTSRDVLALSGQDVLDVLAIETNDIFAETGRLWDDTLTLWLRIAPNGDLDSTLDALAGRRRMLEGWLDPILGLTRIDGHSTDDHRRTPAHIVCELAALTGVPRHEPRLAGLPVAIDALIAPDIRQPTLAGPVICGDHMMAVMTLSGEREDYAPSPLEPLQNLPLPFTWVTRYRGLSRSQARDTLFWRRKQLKQSAADLTANIEGSSAGDRSLYADQLVAETEVTRAAIERGEEGHGRFVSVLTLTSDTPAGLRTSLQTLREAVQQTGFHLRMEGPGAVATWLAALPGHTNDIPREVMVRAQVAADCMPLRQLSPGPACCPSPLLPPATPALLPAITSAQTLQHFHLHVDDVGHSLVFGPTGTGKSVLLGHLIAAWLRYPQAQVIVFDRGRSLRYLTAALQGLWLEPGAAQADVRDHDGAGGVAPLSHIKRLGAQWALTWVSEMLKRGLGRVATPDETREIGEAIGHLAASPHPCLEGLRDLVQDKAVRTVLDSWLTGPRAGTFSDEHALNVGSALAQSTLTVFETEPLMDTHGDIVVLTLDYIFAEVAARFDGRPTLIVIDEAWKLLSHDIFAERLKSWLKEGRKKNVALLMATQSVSDAARAAITADLVDSCPTRLFLANPMAATASQAPDYQGLGLSPERIEVISTLRRKAQLLMIQATCARVLSLPLGPYALSLLGRTSTVESKEVAARAADDPAFWKTDLKHLNIPQALAAE